MVSSESTLSVEIGRVEPGHFIALATTAKTSARKIVHARAVLLCDVDPYAHEKVW